MILRRYAERVRDKLAKFPAVALLGPRQCGKTTLARQLDGVYFDLESPGSATRLDVEWNALAAGDRLVILDEAQAAPEIFARLRGTIDADRKRVGRYLLLGSVSPAVMRNVSESLAGRLGIVRMTPFILSEVEWRVDDLWLRGGYPDGGILDPHLFPEWAADYLDTLVARDMPAWGLPARPQQTDRLLHMIAALHGQPLNASRIGASLALDQKTIQSRCDFLEGVFLIRRLSPYFANLKKRLVRTPRLYWRDSGLLHALLGVEDLETLYRQPWVGASWEGFVIEQTLASIEAGGKRVRPFFFRTSDGYEVDLVLDWGTERWAVEVKLTSAPSPAMVFRLRKTADMIGAIRRVLVCRIDEEVESEAVLVTDLARWLRRV